MKLIPILLAFAVMLVVATANPENSNNKVCGNWFCPNVLQKAMQVVSDQQNLSKLQNERIKAWMNKHFEENIMFHFNIVSRSL